MVWALICHAHWKLVLSKKLNRGHFPEGRTGIACLEPLLGKYCFEGGVQILCVVGDPIRMIHILF